MHSTQCRTLPRPYLGSSPRPRKSSLVIQPQTDLSCSYSTTVFGCTYWSFLTSPGAFPHHRQQAPVCSPRTDSGFSFSLPHYLLAFKVSDEKFTDNLFKYLYYVISNFSLTVFKIPSLSFGFESLLIMHLVVLWKNPNKLQKSDQQKAKW